MYMYAYQLPTWFDNFSLLFVNDGEKHEIPLIILYFSFGSLIINFHHPWLDNYPFDLPPQYFVGKLYKPSFATGILGRGRIQNYSYEWFVFSHRWTVLALILVTLGKFVVKLLSADPHVQDITVAWISSAGWDNDGIRWRLGNGECVYVGGILLKQSLKKATNHLSLVGFWGSWRSGLDLRFGRSYMLCHVVTCGVLFGSLPIILKTTQWCLVETTTIWKPKHCTQTSHLKEQR